MIATEEIFLANERARRARRALALTSLLARAAREPAGVESTELTGEISNGIADLEYELVEDLAKLMSLRPPREIR